MDDDEKVPFDYKMLEHVFGKPGFVLDSFLNGAFLVLTLILMFGGGVLVLFGPFVAVGYFFGVTAVFIAIGGIGVVAVVIAAGLSYHASRVEQREKEDRRGA